MTRDEYLTVLDTEPATRTQRGAIMRECDRLGLADRAERLAMLAALLDLDALSSTAELTMGQAGKLVNLLQRTSGRADLPEITTAARAGDDGQDDDGEFISVAEAIKRITLMIAVAAYGKGFFAESGDIALNIQRLCATGGLPSQGRTNSSA